jgi:hypothetical protein
MSDEEAPADKPDRPPLSLDELRETLDRLGDLSLRLNDRVEEQTKVISHATTMTNEARRAAEATKQQTDPDQYAEYAVEVIDKRLEKRMQDIKQTASDLLKASNYTREVLSKADQDRTDAQHQLWEREQKLDQWKSRWPLFGLGALVLALAMTVTLPRFLATNEFTCELMVGFVWTATSEATDVCVRYVE